jgi:hypothetical protein
MTRLSTSPTTAQPHLKRVLGRRDLVLLFVVAVFNLNVVPSIAANGGVTIWLWIISLAAFLLAARHRRDRTRAPLSRRRRSLPLGERSLRRLPRISLRLVLLDQQHALRADGHAVFRRRIGLVLGPGHQRSPTTRPSRLIASIALLTCSPFSTSLAWALASGSTISAQSARSSPPPC